MPPPLLLANDASYAFRPCHGNRLALLENFRHFVQLPLAPLGGARLAEHGLHANRPPVANSASECGWRIAGTSRITYLVCKAYSALLSRILRLPIMPRTVRWICTDAL